MISNDSDVYLEHSERPLSPVLSRSRNTKVFYKTRKLKCKSETKSSDPVLEGDSCQFDAIPLSHNENSIKNREKKQCSDCQEFKFKIPISPIRGASPKLKNHVTTIKTTTNTGFQTCSGKLITIINSEEHAHLFDDILDPHAENRPKKLNFLRRNDGLTKINEKLNASSSTFVKLKDSHLFYYKPEVAELTQENKCNISDSKVLWAANEYGNKSGDSRLMEEFYGFSSGDGKESIEYVQRFQLLFYNKYYGCCPISRNMGEGKRNRSDDETVQIHKKLKSDCSEHPVKGTHSEGGGFIKASGGGVRITDTSLRKTAAMNTFSGCFDEETTTLVRSVRSANDISCFDSPILIAKQKSSCDLRKTGVGFHKASGKAIQISEKAFQKAQQMFDYLSDEENIILPTESKARQDLTVQGSDAQKLIYDHNSTFENTVIEFKTPRNTMGNCLINVSNGKRKRSLGISSCSQIKIPEHNLGKAKLLFEEKTMESPKKKVKIVNQTPKTTPPQTTIITSKEMSRAKAIFGDEDFSDIFGTSNNNFPSCSSKNQIYNSTPLKPINVQFSNAAQVMDVSLGKTSLDGSSINLTAVNTHNIIFRDPSNVDLNDWHCRLQKERQKLEALLEMVICKQNALNAIRSSSQSSVKFSATPGILSIAKSTGPRVSLRNLVHSKRPGAESDSIKDSYLFKITPQNALLVHFSAKKVEHFPDGAVIVPDENNFVGASEIEIGFNSMSGVEPRLIPKGWFRNHYKWIVWKLASYERMFPIEFKGALDLANVMQQLKYRYDREIDKVERSAIRKIYEKDDTSQKRMVLCVSNITNQAGKCQLELTDGWYAINTVIDQPLSYQIFKGNIQVGTKLMIYGSELYNCDGCYPLETTNLVYMRINFNCTRRAAWYTKMGYQPDPGPFPIQIGSVHQSGGHVGCLKVYIVRVYPEKIMERENAGIVWRNKKADERRAYEWEMEMNKKIDLVRRTIDKEIEEAEVSCRLKDSKVKYSVKDVTDVSCSKTLFNIYESSLDPDSVEQLLTASQKNSLIEFKRSQLRERQEKIKFSVRQKMDEIKMSKRDVTRVLKVLVMDLQSNGDYYSNVFNVWRPTLTHFQLIKEGMAMTVYNVLPGRGGEFSSVFKTKFKPILNYDVSRFEKFNRTYVPIYKLMDFSFKPDFNEFDTVGIVLKYECGINFQYIWLVDCQTSPLLIQIFESSKNCILLDNLKRGQRITVCNLGYQEPDDEYACALAGHYTVIAKYSQCKHLQDAMLAFENNLPQNLEEYLIECDNKIQFYEPNPDSGVRKMNSRNTQNSELLDESSLDTAMSMLDIDKLLTK